MPLDYDHELQNGWDELGKLVLSELRRLANGQETLTGEVTEIKTVIASQTAVSAQVSSMVQDHESRLRPIEADMQKSEGASGANKKALGLAAGVIVTLGGWVTAIVPNLIGSSGSGTH